MRPGAALRGSWGSGVLLRLLAGPAWEKGNPGAWFPLEGLNRCSNHERPGEDSGRADYRGAGGRRRIRREGCVPSGEEHRRPDRKVMGSGVPRISYRLLRNK